MLYFKLYFSLYCPNDLLTLCLYHQDTIFSCFQYQGVLLNDKGACFLVVYCGRLRNNERCDTLEAVCMLIRGTPYGRAGHVAGLPLRCRRPSLEGY